MKKEQGITLIALVITIIVLLILAAVSISLVVGENGILTQATHAVDENDKSEEGEKVKLAAAASIDTKDLKVKKSLLENELDNSFGSGKYELTEETGYYLITIKSSGRQYKIDSYGNATIKKDSEDSNQDDSGFIQKPTKISIQGDTYLDIYSELVLHAVDGSGAAIDENSIEWSSSNSDIAVVYQQNGYGEGARASVLSGPMGGTATIRATSTYDSSIYGEITITVEETGDDSGFVQKPTKISILGDTYLDSYSELILHAVDGSGAAIDDDSIEWSSNSDIIEVYNMPGYPEGARASVLSGPMGGTATIRATSKYDSSIYGEITITVYGEELYPYTDGPTSINIEFSSTTITKGSISSIYVEDETGMQLPSTEFDWSFSNSGIVSIEPLYEGAPWFDIAALKAGTVTITATSKYNPTVYDTITITVVE